MTETTKISDIQGDVSAIRATYKASPRHLTHEYKVRGRIVSRTNIRESRNHSTSGIAQTYDYVRFADTGAYAFVNSANIKEKALPRQVGLFA